VRPTSNIAATAAVHAATLEMFRAAINHHAKEGFHRGVVRGCGMALQSVHRAGLCPRRRPRVLDPDTKCSIQI
jgi:hypothetical protein